MAESLPKSLLDLNRIHLELEEMFCRHQVALLKADYPAAKSLLKDFEENLLNHMKEEEDILLPLYRQRAGQVRGGDADIFVLEHKKIVEWLGRLKLRLSRLNPPEVDMKNLIALLDDEAHFKKYTEHHTLRENRIFYPEIERILDEKEKGHLLRLLTFSPEEKTAP
jgi:iron-sulfur cluster repair protein YtfE (RIC family)